GGRLRRPHPQGREAGGLAGTGTDQVRTGDQFQDCAGARPGCAADAARARRRGDRITPSLLRLASLAGGAEEGGEARLARRTRELLLCPKNSTSVSLNTPLGPQWRLLGWRKFPSPLW